MSKHIKYDSTFPRIAHQIMKEYKRHANEKKLKYELEWKDFLHLIELNCFYCDSPPSNTREINSAILHYNGIDRMNPLLGYKKTNCITCCHKCNYAKSAMSLKEFISWILKLGAKIAKDM